VQLNAACVNVTMDICTSTVQAMEMLLVTLVQVFTATCSQAL
jgi:hypothetical protein